MFPKPWSPKRLQARWKLTKHSRTEVKKQTLVSPSSGSQGLVEALPELAELAHLPSQREDLQKGFKSRANTALGVSVEGH